MLGTARFLIPPVLSLGTEQVWVGNGEPYLHPHMHSGCQAVPETQGHCLKPERHVPSPRLLGLSPRDHSLDQCLQ